jgi:integrase
MGRKRLAGVMMPEHVHAVKRPSGKTAYYYQAYRNTPRQQPRIRLPDDPISPAFWEALQKVKAGPGQGAMAKMIDAYLASPKFSEKAVNTQREYRRYLDTLRSLWGDLDPHGVQPMHIAELRDQYGKTPAKANNLVATIGALYAWGIERGFATRNPTHDVSRLGGGEYEPWPEAIWNLAIEHLRPEVRLACVLALYTGQRLGDVLRMQLGDIKDNVVTVKQAKTGKILQIPLHTELRPIVSECRERSAIYLIAKVNGDPFTTDDLHAMWTREMKKEPQAAIRREGYVFHGLRKNACIKLFEVGCTEKEVESITGQSPAMVAHYSKRVNQLKLAKRAMAKMEGSNTLSGI